MREIKFESIFVQAFSSFVEPTTVALNFPGVTFLRGKNLLYPRLDTNGVGKSSLLKALTWCLKGKTIENLHGTDIRARGANNEPTIVTLKVVVDSKSHTIERTLSPSRLILDGKKVGQDEIDRLIPLSLLVIENTLVFGQGNERLFLDQKPREKMELLSDVLSLDRWDKRAERASKAAQVADKQLAKIISNVDQIGAKLSHNRTWINLTQKDSDCWNQDRTQKLEIAKKQLDDASSRLNTVSKLRDDADLKLDTAAAELKALNTEVARLRETWVKIRDTGDPCPKCGQPVVNPKKLQKAEDAYLDASEDAAAFKEEVEKHRDILMRVSPQAAKLEQQVADLTEQVNNFNTSTNPYSQSLLDVKRQNRELLADLDNLEIELNQVEERKNHLTYWAKEGFKLVKLYLIEELLSELQLVTERVLSDLGLDGWKVNYVIERETKTGTVHQGLSTLISKPYEQPVRWETFSGGEGQRLRLGGAIALSIVLLRHIGASVNFLALDEPTQRLSGTGIEDLCMSLADYANESNTSIWFIDQHAIESSYFSRVLTVVMDRYGSHLE